MVVPAIDAVDIAVTFGAVQALPRTSLCVADGESVAIMGPSGSGKSTLLSCIQGIGLVSQGSLRVLGQEQSRVPLRQRSSLRLRHMGLIQQTADLLPEFSATENVAFPLLVDGRRRSGALAAAADALEAVGLRDKADADVRTLSGGEAHRVAVARALARPDIRLIVADEPTAALDAENAMRITDLILQAAEERRATVILATHDPRVADRCGRIERLTRERDVS